jgi:hypothetical protein
MRAVITTVILLAGVASAFAGKVNWPYPKSALDAGIEGWVEVNFWVDHNCDLIVNVHAAEPQGVFDDAAVNQFHKITTSETELIEWSKVPGHEEPGGSPISPETYLALMDAVKKEGPWPLTRTHYFYFVTEPSDKIVCYFSRNRNLESVEIYSREEIIRQLSDSEIQPGEFLRDSESTKIIYSLEE